MGKIVSPQIVSIDENRVNWIVSENDVTTTETLFKPISGKLLHSRLNCCQCLADIKAFQCFISNVKRR